MNYFPFENLTYKTNLNKEEILDKLFGMVNQGSLFQYPSSKNTSGKSYAGQINADNFNIRRIVGYRNSFAPIITGTIQKDIVGSIINIKLKLHPFAIAFLCFWCASFIFGSLGFLPILSVLHIFTQTNPSLNDLLPAPFFIFPALILLIPLGMLVFIYALTMISFNYESHKIKTDLQQILKAEAIK